MCEEGRGGARRPTRKLGGGASLHRRAVTSREARVGSVLVLGLALVFFLFFQVTKQNPALSAVNASATDPYDAIGSFGIQAATALGLLSAYRAFRLGRRRAQPDTDEDTLFLARTQMAAVLAVVVTLAGDVVAMARHPSVWLGSTAGHVYAALLGIVALLTVAAGVCVRRTARALSPGIGATSSPAAPVSAARGAWTWAAIATLVFTVVLALYPENLTQSTPGALLTVLAGVVLLFASIRALVVALVPYPGKTVSGPGKRSTLGWLGRPSLQWGGAIAAGIIIGLILVLAEFRAEVGAVEPPLARLLRVACVYVGLETAGVLIGYLFLRRPLGLMLQSLEGVGGPGGKR